MWNNNNNGGNNNNGYKALKPLFKNSYDKPAKGVYLKQPSEQVYKVPKFKKLKQLITKI